MKEAHCVIYDVTPYLCQTPVKRKEGKNLCKIRDRYVNTYVG